MLGEEGAKHLFEWIHQNWIEPEIQRRKDSGSLPVDFKVWRCRIKLPQSKPPIVEFNGEVGWVTKVKPAPGVQWKAGQPVFLHDILEIAAVNPPEVDGQRVAFIYLYWNSRSYSIIVDFEPNAPNNLRVNIKDEQSWPLSDAIVESLQAIIDEKAIRSHDVVQSQLAKIGLWAAPALIPFPISKISVHLAEGDAEKARQILLQYCTPDFLERLTDKWWNLAAFERRRELVKEALHSHRERKYRLSIYALSPQLEGIITDWLYTQLSPKDVPFNAGSKAKTFQKLVSSHTTTGYTSKRVTESATEFVMKGPLYATFDWLGGIDQSFPNRHAVEHGRYDDAFFTEENSLKLFLLLDTIHHILAEHQSKQSADRSQDSHADR